MKKKILSYVLIGILLTVVFGLTALFYELLIGFPSYIDSLPDTQENNWAGLGIIGILMLGIYAAIFCVAIIIMLSVAHATIKKKDETQIKGLSIFATVVLFILATGCYVYGILMISAYPTGLFGKVIYFSVAIISTLLAIFTLVQLKKSRVVQIEPVQEIQQEQQAN